MALPLYGREAEEEVVSRPRPVDSRIQTYVGDRKADVDKRGRCVQFRQRLRGAR